MEKTRTWSERLVDLISETQEMLSAAYNPTIPKHLQERLYRSVLAIGVARGVGVACQMAGEVLAACGRAANEVAKRTFEIRLADVHREVQETEDRQSVQ